MGCSSSAPKVVRQNSWAEHEQEQSNHLSANWQFSSEPPSGRSEDRRGSIAEVSSYGSLVDWREIVSFSSFVKQSENPQIFEKQMTGRKFDDRINSQDIFMAAPSPRAP